MRAGLEDKTQAPFENNGFETMPKQGRLTSERSSSVPWSRELNVFYEFNPGTLLMLSRTFHSLEAVATELKRVRTEIVNKQRRRTRLVTGLLRQVDNCLGRLAEVQEEMLALQTACEVLSSLEGA